jgi:hypothetical protein
LCTFFPVIVYDRNPASSI